MFLDEMLEPEQKKFISIFVFMVIYANIIDPYLDVKLIEKTPNIEYGITFVEDKNIVVGEYDFDEISLVKSTKDCEIISHSEVDTNLVGEQEITFKIQSKFGHLKTAKTKVIITE